MQMHDVLLVSIDEHIRQVPLNSEIPPGTVCTASIWIVGDDLLLSSEMRERTFSMPELLKMARKAVGESLRKKNTQVELLIVQPSRYCEPLIDIYAIAIGGQHTSLQLCLATGVWS